MGFKTDNSFLEKLTMGATATCATMDYLSSLGFAPTVLERYSASNKIWSTKVKRLRLADVLCMRTGIRVEVRAKSDLQIKMSDSPRNPERRWDSGLRDDDLVAFVGCHGGDAISVRGTPQFFRVGDLRTSAHLARLGPPKSASEGAERDLTWRSTVPRYDGVVVAVDAERIIARMDSGRNQHYRLEGKFPYVALGDHFTGGATFLAGDVPAMVDPATLLGTRWSPGQELGSSVPSDRFGAAVALGRSEKPDSRVVAGLAAALESETEPRTALEIAGALARLGAGEGFEFLVATGIQGGTTPPSLRMEAVLMLSEIPDARSAVALDAVASSTALRGDELRQAAVWGLGQHGVRNYDLVVKYLTDEENDVALHAMAALGADAPTDVIEHLLKVLLAADERGQAAASEALRIIGSEAVGSALIACASSAPLPWVFATLGRLPPETLGRLPLAPSVAAAIAPVRVLAATTNWLAAHTTATRFQFLLQQTL